MNTQENKKIKLKTTATPEIKKGSYANAIRVTATDSEVVLDFAFIQPAETKKENPEIVSKIVLNPNFAKRIPQYIEDAIKENNHNK